VLDEVEMRKNKSLDAVLGGIDQGKKTIGNVLDKGDDMFNSALSDVLKSIQTQSDGQSVKPVLSLIPCLQYPSTSCLFQAFGRPASKKSMTCSEASGKGKRKSQIR
jgi:hypothetical protein